MRGIHVAVRSPSHPARTLIAQPYATSEASSSGSCGKAGLCEAFERTGRESWYYLYASPVRSNAEMSGLDWRSASTEAI